MRRSRTLTGQHAFCPSIQQHRFKWCGLSFLKNLLDYGHRTPRPLGIKKTALNLKENKHMKWTVYSDNVCSMSEHHSFETNVFTCKLSYFYMQSVLCLVQGSNPDKTTSLLKLTVCLICITTPRKVSNMTKIKMNETLKYHLVCDLLCLSYAR